MTESVRESAVQGQGEDRLVAMLLKTVLRHVTG